VVEVTRTSRAVHAYLYPSIAVQPEPLQDHASPLAIAAIGGCTGACIALHSAGAITDHASEVRSAGILHSRLKAPPTLVQWDNSSITDHCSAMQCISQHVSKNLHCVACLHSSVYRSSATRPCTAPPVTATRRHAKFFSTWEPMSTSGPRYVATCHDECMTAALPA